MICLFQPLRDAFDVNLQFESCVFDFCAGDGGEEDVCNSIDNFVTDGEADGVVIDDWRTPQICRKHFYYFICSITNNIPNISHDVKTDL